MLTYCDREGGRGPERPEIVLHNIRNSPLYCGSIAYSFFGDLHSHLLDLSIMNEIMCHST